MLPLSTFTQHYLCTLVYLVQILLEWDNLLDTAQTSHWIVGKPHTSGKHGTTQESQPCPSRKHQFTEKGWGMQKHFAKQWCRFYKWYFLNSLFWCMQITKCHFFIYFSRYIRQRVMGIQQVLPSSTAFWLQIMKLALILS